jgi:GMP synthase-like glutamine amidotransferase
MRVRIGLLLMDDLPEHAVPVRGDYPALYDHLFRDVDAELVTVAIHRGQTPTSIRDCDGWIVGGSRYSVYDDLEWIRTTEEIVRVAVATEHPIVGICFGHQLMAQALGGRTEQVGWGVGARHYDTIEPLAWFPEGEQRTTLLASHQDQVVELPAGATVWSASDYCPIAGMTIGARAWSMQGHPEFTPDVCDVLYESRRHLLGDPAVDAAKRSLSTPLSNAGIAEAIVRFIAG